MTPSPTPHFNSQTPIDLSIIVVARNEAATIERLLKRLQAQHKCGWRVEIIVCDGGSSDETAQVARDLGAAVEVQSGGRGAQLRRGAEMAHGEWLWFLHADCFPARASVRAMQRASLDARVIGGNFRLKFASSQYAARVFELIARVQRSCGVYYGDSGIWVRRDVYEQLGGFANWPLFEDYDFVRRMEHFARGHGKKTLCLRPALCVSARRFARHPWRVLWLWARLQWQFSRGISPVELANFYREHRE